MYMTLIESIIRSMVATCLCRYHFCQQENLPCLISSLDKPVIAANKFLTRLE